MRFTEAFLIYCLLESSAPFDDASDAETKFNQLETARRGRDPQLRLRCDGAETALGDWARHILDGVGAVAEMIDRTEGSDSYSGAVNAAREMIADPDTTPSARILEELRTANCGFFEFGLAESRGHRDYFSSITVLSDSRREELTSEARESIVRQHDIEVADDIDIDEYLAHYFAAD
jgi:glutamate--cysteine ligase